MKYSSYRQTDERMAEYVYKELANANMILSFGSETGSYEPTDKYVVAVEPSTTMRQQMLDKNKVPAINAKAYNLPFDSNSFDASMPMITVNHWHDMDKGLKELSQSNKTTSCNNDI